MTKCKDCKFWDKSGQPFHDDIYAMCALIYEGIISVEKKAIAYVSDCNSGNYVHHLHTRYDFGCILGQKKSPNSRST